MISQDFGSGSICSCAERERAFVRLGRSKGVLPAFQFHLHFGCCVQTGQEDEADRRFSFKFNVSLLSQYHFAVCTYMHNNSSSSMLSQLIVGYQQHSDSNWKDSSNSPRHPDLIGEVHFMLLVLANTRLPHQVHHSSRLRRTALCRAGSHTAAAGVV